MLEIALREGVRQFSGYVNRLKIINKNLVETAKINLGSPASSRSISISLVETTAMLF